MSPPAHLARAHGLRTFFRHRPDLTQTIAWAALIAALGLSVLSLARLGTLEFGPLAQRVISVDEAYFAACAVRGTTIGEIPIAGCHDNKAPLIFLLYQLLQRNGSPYDVTSIKVAAFTTIVLVAGLAGCVALRLAGMPAALAAPALIIQALVSDAELLAFKTETVGAAFMLGGLLVLGGKSSPGGPGSLFVAGLLAGLAVVTKQTYAFLALAVIVWLAISVRHVTGRRFRIVASRAAIYCAGALVPFALLLIAFYVQGRHVEFLSSFFLYPMVYGGASAPHSPLREVLWRLAAILETLSQRAVLIGLFAAAATLTVSSCVRTADEERRGDGPRLLILLVTAMLLGVLVLSPVYFAYHAIPMLVCMAMLGSAMIGDFWPKLCRVAPSVVVSLSAGLVAVALLSAATTWASAGGRNSTLASRDDEARVEDGRGHFGFVLGTWPTFYVENGLIPASSIQFPWALPGLPATWHFTPPDPATVRGRLLASVQRRNVETLFAELRRTPPRYLLIMNDMAHRPGSPRLVDLPGFDDYVHERCTDVRSVSLTRFGVGTIYRCGVGAADRTRR